MALALVGMTALPAQAAVITNGQINPADPATWGGNAVPLYIGQTADGSVTVNGGSTVSRVNQTVNLGSAAGVTGSINVDGAGSSWSGGVLYNVGNGGTGVVNVSNGGSFDGGLRVGWAMGSTGLLNISSGGILTQGANLGAGMFSTGIATVDGVGSQLNTALTVGERGTGSLTIKNGGSVTTSFGSVGRYDTSTGTARVDGPGSSWNIGNSGLQVGIGLTGGGSGAVGRLTVTNGAVLSVNGSVQDSGLGINVNSKGTVMVQGAGSQWTNLHGVNVGQSGTGQLSLSNGAVFTASGMTVNSLSVVTTDVGTGSSVNIGGGTGTLTNNGTVRVVAGAGAATGTYTPVSAGTWAGTGQVQGLGGVWNNATHTMTVSTAATGVTGAPVTIDRVTTQRMLITDVPSGKSVGLGFQSSIVPANLSLIASLMDGSQLTALQGLLDPAKLVLGAWDFSATGYTAGDPVYLSLQVGAGQQFNNLDIWHFNGSSWDKYLNSDLAYDGTFASFVATSFSGYAVSGVAPVPVPAAVWLFGSGLAAMVGVARRKFTRTA